MLVLIRTYLDLSAASEAVKELDDAADGLMTVVIVGDGAA